MTHKDEVYKSIYNLPKTNEKIHQDLPHLSIDKIRVALNRLIDDGIVSVVGKRDKHRVYARDEINVQSYQNSPDSHAEYPDLMHDTEACRLAYQFYNGNMKKFLNSKKMDDIRVGMINAFSEIEPPQQVIPIVQGLLKISSCPDITIELIAFPVNQVFDYYTTKIPSIFYAVEHNNYRDHFLSKHIPTVSPKSGKIITGPYPHSGKVKVHEDFYSTEEKQMLAKKEKAIKDFKAQKNREEKEKRQKEKKKGKIGKLGVELDTSYFERPYSSLLSLRDLSNEPEDSILRYKPPSRSKRIINIEEESWYITSIKGILCCGVRITPILDEDRNSFRSDQFESLSDKTIFWEDSGSIKYEYFTIKDHKYKKFYCFLWDRLTNWEWKGYRMNGDQSNRINEGESPRDVLNLWHTGYEYKSDRTFTFNSHNNEKIPQMFIQMEEEKRKFEEKMMQRMQMNRI